MKLFRKKESPAPTSRRRPSADEPAAPPRFAYRSQRAASPESQTTRQPLETLRLADSRPNFLRVAPPAVIGLVVIGLLLLVSSFSSPSVTIHRDVAAINQSFLQPDAVYQASAQRQLQSSVFNYNKLTANTAALRLALLQEHPELEDVTVRTSMLSWRPQLTLKPYDAALVLASRTGTALVIDQTGRAQASTSTVPDAISQLPVVNDDTGTTLMIGKPALPSSTVSFIATVYQSLTTNKVAVSQMRLTTAYELDVKPAGKPYLVKFNLTGQARDQAGTFLAVKQRLDREATTPQAYVDVRVPERAYYK